MEDDATYPLRFQKEFIHGRQSPDVIKNNAYKSEKKIPLSSEDVQTRIETRNIDVFLIFKSTCWHVHKKNRSHAYIKYAWLFIYMITHFIYAMF